MDKFLEFRRAVEQSRERKALELFDELYAGRKEYYNIFRQLVLAGARHRPGKNETHAFLPLSAALESMQFLRTREEVGLMTRRLIMYLCALKKGKTLEAKAGAETGDAREHSAAVVRSAALSLGEKPGPFAFACAARELADYVGEPGARRILAGLKAGKLGSPKPGGGLRTPKKDVDEVLLEASARAGAGHANLLTGNYLLKTRRLFDPKTELHLFAGLEKRAARERKALTEKKIADLIGLTHGELELGEAPADALLEHLLEPSRGHALYVLRELIEQRATLRAVYPAFLIGGYYCGPKERLEELVVANAACQVAERIEKPRALIPLAQALLAIEAGLRAGKRVEIPTQIVFPWQ